MSPIMDLFAKSPMKPMQTHMLKVQQCVDKLPAFFDAVVAQDWDAVEIQQKEIRALENEADEMKKELRLQLPKGLFMPVARTDLLAILTAQDKIANRAKDIAGIMTGRRMQFPSEINDYFKKYLEGSIKACAQATKAIQQLDELLESGFRGREVDIVEEMIHRLDELESKADKLQVKMRRKLFELEDELPPVKVMFMYRVIDWVGDLADRAQQVGARLEQLLAR